MGDIFGWIGGKISGAAGWVGGKIGDGFVFVFKKGVGLICGLDGIFIIVAIVGVYFIMAGNRKLGTKLTSLSFLIFAICKVISSC